MNNKNIAVFFLLISLCSCGNSQELINAKDIGLKIQCENQIRIKSDSLYLSFSYINTSNDTILIPYWYLRYNNFQKIRITGDVDFSNGIDGDYIVPKENNNIICNLTELKDNDRYLVLNPKTSFLVNYSLEEKGYFPLKELTFGEEYTYYIKLTIPKEFKNICSNMWVGSISSNMGTFIVE